MNKVHATMTIQVNSPSAVQVNFLLTGLATSG